MCLSGSLSAVACSGCFFKDLQMTVSILMVSKLCFKSLCVCWQLSGTWEIVLLLLGTVISLPCTWSCFIPTEVTVYREILVLLRNILLIP